MAKPGDHAGEILVLFHPRMSVVARDPQLRGIPLGAPLELFANGRDGVVHDVKRLGYRGAVVSERVRRFVDARQRGEHERRSRLADASDDATGDLTIDFEPSPHVATKVRTR